MDKYILLAIGLGLSFYGFYLPGLFPGIIYCMIGGGVSGVAIAKIVQ